MHIGKYIGNLYAINWFLLTTVPSNSRCMIVLPCEEDFGLAKIGKNNRWKSWYIPSEHRLIVVNWNKFANGRSFALALWGQLDEFKPFTRTTRFPRFLASSNIERSKRILFVYWRHWNFHSFNQNERKSIYQIQYKICRWFNIRSFYSTVKH